MGSHDALPDGILELVLLGVDSPLCLLRAAATCKRWRRIVASDAFRALLLLHGAPPVVAGYYYNDPASSRPRFEPSPSAAAAAIDGRHFSLDFLPGNDATSSWTIKDSRGSLLLLFREDGMTRHQELFVCEPLTRCHELIPPLNPPLRFSRFSGLPPPVRLAAVGDGSSDEGGGGGAMIGMSRFRLLRVVETAGRIRACTFTSGSSSWREASIERPLKLHFVGVAAGRWYWYDMKKVLALDQSTLDFSSFVLPGVGIGDVTLAIGRDGEVRVVSKENGNNNMKIFARVYGRGGADREEWMLEKTMQLSAAMLGLPRLPDFFLTWHQPVDAGAVQIWAPGSLPHKIDITFIKSHTKKIYDVISTYDLGPLHQ